MSNSDRQIWSLQSVLKGADFNDQVQMVSLNLKRFAEIVYSPEYLIESILLLQEIAALFKDLDSYVCCRLAENTKNADAVSESAVLGNLNASIESASLLLANQMARLSDQAFHEMTHNPILKEITFYLWELRAESKTRLSEDLEAKVTALATDGYHSYWGLYRSLIGKLEISINGCSFSIGQADNLLMHSNRKVRKEAFIALQTVWKNQADVFAQILNHIAGFRLNVYRFRDWKDVLFEPLRNNRLTSKTLEIMWTAIDESKAPFLRYFQKKAELLGVEQLSWYDLQTPLNKKRNQKLSYADGLQFITKQFQGIHPKMADFVKKMDRERWIEAADRKDKQAGGFCVGFPSTAQSRIFMTYDEESMFSLATLAHELGHAYHYEILYRLPYFSQSCRMAVAETASTFAEMLVIDRAIKTCNNSEEKLFLLDDKLQRTIIYLMNIHCRFLFEKNFYHERKRGHVKPEQLCALMEEAQKQAYLNSLKEYHPYFWVSKLHFYFTEYPFYNFPYTFGFLFSLGIYTHLQLEDHFAEKYDALLLDSGRMSMEDLAKKHLDQDITQPHFWHKTLKTLHKDVDEFLVLANG